ncbi:MAG: glycosyltransferase family 4 protein [Lachnospiraceae bacterium]|nr:glycosyltransferase family 4 protein [Lachnospiraceae bacterium]
MKSVKITMVSNYINHHQMPFCEALCELKWYDFVFVQTTRMEQKRIDMGWYVDPASLPYVMTSYDDPDGCAERIMSSDILLIGWMEDEPIVRPALERARKRKKNSDTPHQLIIRISERLYREGQWKAISPRGLLRKYKEHIRYRHSDVYLLCNGAYVASDFNLIGAYRGKMYRFGYFPRTRYFYDERNLWNNKPDIKRVSIDHSEDLPGDVPVLTDNEIRIIWAGRFLPLKHPEYVVQLASDLVRRGYRFHIDMIGSGELEEDLKTYINEEMIEDYVTFHGFIPPDKVRFMMERSHIHLFTSNFLEGWGAVINEAMDAGCAVVASRNAGASLFLIDHEHNGLLYNDDSYEDMLTQVLKLMEEPEAIEQYGREAYKSICTLWNAQVAADRLVKFYEGFVSGRLPEYEAGPFSKAEIIKPGFWNTGKLKD